MRIDLRRAESIKSGTDVVGNRVRARVVKNKVAPPFKVAEFDIMFNQGVSLEFYSFGDTRLGQGRENSKTFLRDNQEIANSIESMIRENGAITN